MSELCQSICPQAKRALRLLINKDRPQVDQTRFIAAMPGKTPTGAGDLMDLIIQIILALLENKDKPDPEPPMPPPRK